jgi:hypothetical protein
LRVRYLRQISRNSLLDATTDIDNIDLEMYTFFAEFIDAVQKVPRGHRRLAYT